MAQYLDTELGDLIDVIAMSNRVEVVVNEVELEAFSPEEARRLAAMLLAAAAEASK